MQIKHVKVQGEQLRYAVRKGQGIPLIICSELGANMELMQPFLDALPDAEVVIFDAPGTGRSSRGRVLRRMSGHANLVIGLLEDCHYKHEVDLLGVGWGGFVVQQLAHDYPKRVRRMVLVSSSPGQIMFPGRIKDVIRLATPKRFASARHYTRIAEEIYGGRAKHEPELIRENAANAIRPSKRGYLSQLLAVAGFSSLNWLHRLRQPTLILAGDDDPIVPLVNARLLNLFIPRSRLQVIKGAGHLLLITRAEDAARHVRNFLGRRNVRDELPTKDTL